LLVCLLKTTPVLAKLMSKCLLLILFLSFAGVPAALSQGLTVSNIAAGPYTPGSSISALLDIPNTSCIRPGNNFTLHLSDASGSFANETQIGTFQGFYTAFLNGTIPAATAPGTGYRLRIKSTTPAITSNSSVPFEIRAGTSLDARISSLSINAANPDVFGFCSGNNNYTFFFNNESDPSSLVNATVINELSKTTAAEIVFDNPAKPFTAQLAHYTVFVRAVSPAGNVATRSYLIINNRALTAFGTSGTNTVCLPNALLEFNVGVTGPDGIENNFPGNIYRVTWGDNREDQFTICDIRNNNGKISHEYTINSCGRTIVSGSNTVNNAFGINISSQNAFCGSVGTPVSTFAKVINKPQNDFSSAGACLNKPATFANTSFPGQDPNSNNPGCDNNAVTYTWFVDGVVVPGAINRPKSFNLVHTFTTPGQHVIRLESTSNTPCPAEPIERTICVQEPPRPSFTINGTSTTTTICANTIIKPVNTSFTDQTCGTNTNNWRVTGPAFTYVNGTTAASAEPEIRFTQAGIYKIQLAIISSACSTVLSDEQTIIVNSAPTATLSPAVTLCNLSSYNFNNTTPGPTRTNFTGTSEALSDTYTWTVTGGAYSFIGDTDLHSKFPVIDFTEYGTYTVSVTHKNNCGSITSSQTLTFEPAPIVNAGTYSPLCFRGAVTLNGTIDGNVTSHVWVGGTGTFSPDRNTLNAVYTPSDAERQAGQANLTLRAVTGLAAPCNVVEGFTTITIIGANTISSAASKSICTGATVNYTPAAAVAGSSFSWVVISAVNATGANPGSGNQINDQLINTQATTNAEVLYRITPSFEGCDGEPFDLRITITPNPVLSAQAAGSDICSGQPAAITLSANLPATQYTWTAVASDPLITGYSESQVPSSQSQINDILINRSAAVGTVTYTIVPVSSSGCLGEAQTIIIRVKTSAENTISASQTICVGTVPAPLAGNTPAGGDGPYTYQWQQSTDGGTTWANITGAQDVNYSPPALQQSTSFRRVVNSFACPGSIQNNSNEVSITVNPDAVAAFTFLSDKGCAPFRLDAANIMATAYPDRNAVYTWYANDVPIGTGLSFPGYTLNGPDEIVTIKLVVSSTFGCNADEMSHEFGTQNSLISRFTQDITESCGATTVTFINQSSPMVNTTFFWDFGNGQTSSDASPAPVSFIPDPTGADKTYTITLTASSACNAGVIYTSTVLIKGQARSVFSPDKTVGCSPMQVTFSNTSPETANTTYVFDFGDGSLPVTTNNRNSVSHVFTAGDEGATYTVTMTATNECGQHSSQHNIRVTPATVVAELVVNSTDQIGCVPFTVPIFNNSIGGTSYHYDFGDGTSLVTVSAPERINHTYTSPGIYTITLTASNSCSTISTTEQVNVLSQPQTGFTVAGIAHVNTPLPFTNTTTDGVYYLWDFGDGNTSREVNPVHTYTREGIYQVRLTATNYNNCQSVSVQSVRVLAEEGELFVPNSFMPTSNNPELREFKAKGFGIASYKLSVFNKWGEIMWETTQLSGEMPAEGWDGKYKGAIVPQGVYFWRMEAIFKNGQTWKGMSYNGASPKTTGILNLIR
jgi:PKD repeat protein